MSASKGSKVCPSGVANIVSKIHNLFKCHSTVIWSTSIFII